MTEPILPGATLGVLGSGQLGRMFAMAARRMGYRVHVFSPDWDTPTGQVADREFSGSYDDLAAVRRFAATCDAITIEFENIPSDTLEAAAEVTPVHPGAHSLHITQHRLREHEFLKSNGFPTAPWAVVRTETQLRNAVKKLGAPGVLKSAGFGYDGKGQRFVQSADDAVLSDWEALDRQECIYEAFVDFEREISVIAVRGLDGAVAVYEPFENEHRNRILHLTRWPAAIDVKLADEAKVLGSRIITALDHVGVLCAELFVTKDGRVLVNELAPRPHNSGHVTIEAARVSQFEQQVRSMCGLLLGDTTAREPGAMLNLLGDLWQDGAPAWAATLAANPGASLHLYGKSDARPGRKMGHITLTGDGAADSLAAAFDNLA